MGYPISKHDIDSTDQPPGLAETTAQVTSGKEIQISASVTATGYSYAKVTSKEDFYCPETSGSLVANVTGEYAVAAWNALAASELKTFVWLQDDEKKAERKPLVKSSFLRDLWKAEGDFEFNLYHPDPDTEDFEIGVEAKVEAAAAGTAQTAISMATYNAPYSHDGFFRVENVTVEHES
jgi:hypothetical protein